MTDFEIRRLRRLLQEELSHYFSDDNFLVTRDEPLDEDSGQFYLTTAEQQVFQIDLDYFHALQLAYLGYEILVDICFNGSLPENTQNLIIKAREICPPSKHGEHEIAFKTGVCEEQWFMWFASTFFDIPKRQSYAYYSKRTFNMYNLLGFTDE